MENNLKKIFTHAYIYITVTQVHLKIQKLTYFISAQTIYIYAFKLLLYIAFKGKKGHHRPENITALPSLLMLGTQSGDPECGL